MTGRSGAFVHLEHACKWTETHVIPSIDLFSITRPELRGKPWGPFQNVRRERTKNFGERVSFLHWSLRGLVAAAALLLFRM